MHRRPVLKLFLHTPHFTDSTGPGFSSTPPITNSMASIRITKLLRVGSALPWPEAAGSTSPPAPHRIICLDNTPAHVEWESTENSQHTFLRRPAKTYECSRSSSEIPLGSCRENPVRPDRQPVASVRTNQVSKFRKQFPKLSLPPCPVPTRWGSWLEVCNYYAHHLQSVKKVVQSFDTDDAAAIQISQELLNDETIEKEDTDIKRYDSLELPIADIDCNSLILTSFSMTEYCENMIACIAGLVVKSLRKYGVINLKTLFMTCFGGCPSILSDITTTLVQVFDRDVAWLEGESPENGGQPRKHV
ncbi:hypothetical protein ANN_24767 [Periplaneta americana]|uniref:DDE-1 domain-containing protein n=1 Tax=Periplaneta americana TaxID=6978 RepID=A0ABQ8RZI4_PERAM|nr:hypothetical protein ANN_24767 [Periplaneta americana]